MSVENANLTKFRNQIILIWIGMLFSEFITIFVGYSSLLGSNPSSPYLNIFRIFAIFIIIREYTLINPKLRKYETNFSNSSKIDLKSLRQYYILKFSQGSIGWYSFLLLFLGGNLFDLLIPTTIAIIKLLFDFPKNIEFSDRLD